MAEEEPKEGHSLLQRRDERERQRDLRVSKKAGKPSKLSQMVGERRM